MPPDARAPAVSVIVAARNARAGVARLLDALEAQTLEREAFEVIVVDDASEDATAMVAEARPGVTVVRRTRRAGAYTARNQGLEQARGDVIAITDADCRPRPDWLQSGLSELERLEADIVGGEVAARASDRPTLAELIDLSQGVDQQRCVELWGFAATANFFARRRVFDRVGPFNGRLISGGDMEFSLRATQAGFRLRYSPAPVVEHAVRRSARAVARKSFRVGFGFGQARWLGSGPARGRTAMWRQGPLYRPRHGLVNAERVHAAGVALTRRQALGLDFAQHLLWRLPTLAGDLAATLRRGRGL